MVTKEVIASYGDYRLMWCYGLGYTVFEKHGNNYAQVCKWYKRRYYADKVYSRYVEQYSMYPV